MIDRQVMMEHIRKNYTYDAASGTVRNKRGRVVKGTPDKDGYICTRLWLAGEKPNAKIHQMVWMLAYGRWPTMIDHINGDKRDNRLRNLREVDNSESDSNRVWAWRPNERTGLPGVSQKANGKYQIGGKKHYHFRDKYEAFFTMTMLGRMFAASGAGLNIK